MGRTTPGLDFIGGIVLKLGTLTSTLFLIDYVLEFHLSTRTLLLSPVLVALVYTVGRIVVRSMAFKMEASGFGARIISGPFGPAGTAHPDHVKIMAAMHPDNYVKGDNFHQLAASTLGTGVFTTDAHLWKFHRSVVRPFFAHSQSASHLVVCDRHAQNGALQIRAHLEAGYAVDLLKFMYHSSLNTATELLFGTCMGFCAAVLQVQNVISRRERLGGLWPLYEIFSDSTAEPMDVISRTLDPIILEAMGKKMMRGSGITYCGGPDVVQENGTLVDQLAALTDEPHQIKDVILNILIPHRSSIALTVACLVYFLSAHPQVASRLRHEILERLGTTSTPSYADLKEMKYLRAVIDETLRLTSPISCITRKSVTSTTWPSLYSKNKPIYIPAQTAVTYDILAIHTSKYLWGPDADKFDPDRFLDNRLCDFLSHNPYIFIPFGAGSRTCCGQEFAYDELSVTVIRFLRNFSKLGVDPSSVDLLNLRRRSTIGEDISSKVRFMLHDHRDELQVRLEILPSIV